jgi:AcrR family transcriptional regulator
MDEKTNTRERILHAAMNRIKHYGYGKTTMAEIATDCGMSPGNIYRFFEAKVDIAEAMARLHHMEQNAALSAIARRRDMRPDERLRLIFFKRMRDNFQLVEQSDKILEVAQVLQRERPLLMSEELAADRVYLKALLEEGAETGLFVSHADYDFVAEMLQCAAVKFSFPQLFSQLTLPKLERELAGVLDLVFAGLLARPEDATKTAASTPREEAIT